VSPRKCDFKGCDRLAEAKQLCAGHYKQQQCGRKLVPLRQYDTNPVVFLDRVNTLAGWAREFGLPYLTLYERVRELGWSIERALTTPVRVYGYPLVWRWKRRPVGNPRMGQRCRVLSRGGLNSVLVEFADGYRVLTSRHAVRRAP